MEQKKYATLEQLLQENEVIRNFAKLCEIPHPSFKEKRISDFLVNWAKERGLEATQDHKWNVLIRKPGTPGYESAPAVMLQAHIDMVCEKAEGVVHDFDKDPIHLELDGDILSTGGRTTLGADDGIGVAYGMTILEAKDIVHPPLEVLFTTAEEEDLSGAQEVDASSFKARMLINIDNAVENQLLAGSCGGMGVELKLSADMRPVPEGCQAYRVKISGLPGGHSGEDIHRGRGNANVLLGRLLREYQKEVSFCLGAVTGGSFRLAIPREAEALLLIPSNAGEALERITTAMRAVFTREYEVPAPEFAVRLEACTYEGKEAASPEGAERLITAILLSPNGISEMNNAVPGVVESSDNMGEIRLEGGSFIIVYEIRASFESTREYLCEKIQVLAGLLKGDYKRFADYPSWSFNPESRLRRLTAETYRREFGAEMETLVVHCGLECGCLFPKMPGLDAISIGPDCHSLHSPSERLSISSSDRVFHLIKEVLAQIH